jgi:hypothetical protein
MITQFNIARAGDGIGRFIVCRVAAERELCWPGARLDFARSPE